MGAPPDTRLSTVPAVLAAHAAADDGAEFLRLVHPGGEDDVLSYGELLDGARGWAGRYGAEGLEPGDRVIVILRHSCDLYAAYLGALLGGQVPAMFSFPSPKFSEQQYFENVGTLIAGAGARAVVAYPDLAAKLAERERAALGDALLLTPDDAAAPADPPAPAEPDPAAPAFVQYSSGTTGLKKGVVVSHRALLAQIDAYGEAIGAGPDDRIVSWLPLYHDMGLITCLFLPLLRRIPVVAMSPFDWVADPAMWPRAASGHGATLSWLPNFAYAFMAANVRDEQLEGVDLSALRGVVNCSEPVTAASHDAFLGRFAGHGLREDALASSYAMAENVFAVTSGGFGTPIPAGPAVVSSGRALPGTEVRITTPEGADVPPGEVGEIVLRSDCLMEGYDGNAEATAEAMRDGWYFSGDLGYLDGADLFVTGRVRDLVIVGGRNVYPQDVEQAVHDVDGVIPGRVVAFGVRDERQGTEGLVVLAETEEEDPDGRSGIERAVYAAVAERTEITPADIRLLEPRTLRKSSSGKLARGANRELYEGLERPPAAPAAAPAGTDLIGSVRAAVTRVARVPSVADDQSILRSGLIDSFGMAELFSELEAATGVRLTADQLGAVDRLDTVAALADLLGGEAGQGEAAPALEAGDIPMSAGPAQAPRGGRAGLWTALYRIVLRRHGVRFGAGLRVLGPVHLQIDGRGSNVQLGRNVTLMPGAHIKNRENGRVVLHDGARLDSVARLVAANDATIELGENVALGLGTVINAGRDVLIGRNSFTAAHCVINASDHGLAAGTPMREQGYEHAPILIGEDVWLGAGVLVSKGARIGHGAVVSAGAAAAGDVPAGAIVHGRPARVIKFRE